MSVDAVIDYTDKHGNETRREFTTEEIYDYEDGVVVIRAFCHSRRDYRTFVSKRIRYWVEPNSGKPVDVGNLGEYIIKVSRRDIPNLAMNLTADANSEISLFKFYIGKFSKCYQITDTGLIRYNANAGIFSCGIYRVCVFSLSLISNLYLLIFLLFLLALLLLQW